MAEADPTQEKLKKYEKAVKKLKAANEKAAKELATQKSTFETAIAEKAALVESLKAAAGGGDKKDDEEHGVYHYEIGSNRGLLKSIKFSKTDMQYIREARFLNQGTSGYDQLGVVYKVTLDMIGNTTVTPTQKMKYTEIIIDPLIMVFGFAAFSDILTSV